MFKRETEFREPQEDWEETGIYEIMVNTKRWPGRDIKNMNISTLHVKCESKGQSPKNQWQIWGKNLKKKTTHCSSLEDKVKGIWRQNITQE